jgi:Restriction alleviation protein Lar
MSELKPCPFCKLDAHVYEERFINLTIGNESSRYWVQCNICGSKSGYESSFMKAIRGWNTRDAKRDE